MSRHEGVSCDACLKSNFRGRRYKCLICYDYDLCANCYEEGATSTSHSIEHPMQCILTRSDFDIYYSGEALSGEQPQSFTCPYCKKMGYSDTGLYDHVSAEHTDTGLEVVCPVCAALPGGDPNLVTDDFAGHLTLEHRTGQRDLISFLDEPSAIRHGGVRRITSSRVLGGPRTRRSNMHFSSSGGISALSPSGRDSVDPIAELLSQLSGVRRGAPQPSQLQQLQMQIQLERQHVSAARQQLERLPRRPHPVSSSSTSANLNSGSSSIGGAVNAINGVISGASSAHHHQLSSGTNSGRDITITSNPLLLTAAATANSSTGSGAAAGAAGSTIGFGASNVMSALHQQQQQHHQSAAMANNQSLLTRFMQPTLDDAELAQLERCRADRSQFVQALLLSTLSLDDTASDPDAGSSVKPADSETNELPLPVESALATNAVTTITKSTTGSGRDEYEAKKQQQDSASNSDINEQSQQPNSQRGPPTKPKTGSSKPAQESRAASGCATVGGGTSDRRGHRAQPQQPSAKTPRELKAKEVPGDR